VGFGYYEMRDMLKGYKRMAGWVAKAFGKKSESILFPEEKQ
jgi:hypothetical protein